MVHWDEYAKVSYSEYEYVKSQRNQAQERLRKAEELLRMWLKSFPEDSIDELTVTINTKKYLLYNNER